MFHSASSKWSACPGFLRNQDFSVTSFVQQQMVMIDTLAKDILKQQGSVFSALNSIVFQWAVLAVVSNYISLNPIITRELQLLHP